jgi:ubiquinone/menaquinone biosynthesis C-methylase UbiE
MSLRALLTFNLSNRDHWVAQQAARVPAGADVLDVGAGSAPYRGLFAHCRYRTQDFAQLRPDQLRHGSYAAIDLVCDATAIPVEAASFDVVLCTEMLEHVPMPQAVVQELARVLRPGGRLLLTAPLGSGIHQEPHHYFGGFTPFWYQRFLTEAGFEDIVVEANAGFFSYFGQESLRFLQMTRPLGGVLPTPWSIGFLPFWLLLLPLLGLGFPLLGWLFDRFDRERRFTVGYHVTATRRADP